MKKILPIITFLLVAFLIIRCSKGGSTNGGNNSTTTTVPTSPSGLVITLTAPLQASLSWVDNSSNENGFTIERKASGGSYTVINSVAANNTIYNDLTVLSNTTYTYRVVAYNATGNSASYTNEVTITTPVVVVLNTSAVSAITSSSALCGGNITSDGGLPITGRGVVWSTSSNPTIALPTKTLDGSGAGSFTSNITGLTPGTTYYVKAYSTNAATTNYGNEIVFTSSPANVTDIDGNIYPTVMICNQIWLQKNLNVTHYSNGDVVPQASSSVPGNVGQWCYYNNDPAMGAVYGKLYNWAAVTDPRGLAPIGWHCPAKTDWNKLVKCVDPSFDSTFPGSIGNSAGGGLKETGVTHWMTPNNNATNSTGFTGLPSGMATNYPNPTFSFLGLYGFWWYTDEQGPGAGEGYTFSLTYTSGTALTNGQYTRSFFLAVRCVKD